ncbi:MAG: hypothetical protein C5B46_08935 [Proteobacteria bacterium]|nr:MAG: hypothetical protein C5B46_08935 [Pseudomonadota bacterium]
MMLAAPAGAAVFDTSPSNLYPTTVPGVASAFVNNTIDGSKVSFDDFWTFDITGPNAHGAGSATTLSTEMNGGSVTQTEFPITLKLVSWNSGTASYSNVLATSGPSLDPEVQSALAAHAAGGAPGHGFYALEVLGATPLGAARSQYSGQIEVVAVPEPATYGLLIAGLLLAALRQRRSDAQG